MTPPQLIEDDDRGKLQSKTVDFPGINQEALKVGTNLPRPRAENGSRFNNPFQDQSDSQLPNVFAKKRPSSTLQDADGGLEKEGGEQEEKQEATRADLSSKTRKSESKPRPAATKDDT